MNDWQRGHKATALRDHSGYPIPRKEYTIRPDNETCYIVQVFRRTDPAVVEALERANHEDLTAALTPLTAHDGGPGRWFSHPPTVRIGRRNVVVRQFRGIDI